MADATVGVAQSSTPDRLIDNDSLTVSAQTVYRQRVRIAGAAATDLAPVDPTFGVAIDVKRVADGANVAEGTTTDAESASGNGSIIAVLKRLRTLLNGGLPAALGANGGLKVEGLSTMTALQVFQAPQTSGGYTIFRLLSAATTNSNNIKGSAGQIFGWFLYNNTSSAKFVKLYNKATAPTVGTDVPVLTVPLPPNGGANIEYLGGVAFGTGIGVGITGAIGDADTTAVALNDVTVNIFYK